MKDVWEGGHVFATGHVTHEKHVTEKRWYFYEIFCSFSFSCVFLSTPLRYVSSREEIKKKQFERNRRASSVGPDCLYQLKSLLHLPHGPCSSSPAAGQDKTSKANSF